MTPQKNAAADDGAGKSVTMKLGKFCNACQAIPIHGYCNIAGCPTGRLRDREFFAVDNFVMAASEGGAMDIATAQDEEIAITIADALTKARAPMPRGDLDIILEWYGGLSLGARQKLSLADLHGLSKRLGALAEGPVMSDVLCSDCPPVGYPTDETRCAPCPRRTSDDAPCTGCGGTGVTYQTERPCACQP